jgi:hypothetical protein
MSIHVDHMGVEVDRNILPILGNFVEGVASYGDAQEAQIGLITRKNKGEGFGDDTLDAASCIYIAYQYGFPSIKRKFKVLTYPAMLPQLVLEMSHIQKLYLLQRCCNLP